MILVGLLLLAAAAVGPPASTLVRLQPVPEVVIYPDGPLPPGAPEDYAAAAACPLLRADGVPLPVPFRIIPFRAQGEGQGRVPDPGGTLRGILRRCSQP